MIYPYAMLSHKMWNVLFYASARAPLCHDCRKGYKQLVQCQINENFMNCISVCHCRDLWKIPHLNKPKTPSSSSTDLMSTKATSGTTLSSSGVKRPSSPPLSPISGRGSEASPTRTKVKKRLLLPTDNNQVSFNLF